MQQPQLGVTYALHPPPPPHVLRIVILFGDFLVIFFLIVNANFGNGVAGH